MKIKKITIDYGIKTLNYNCEILMLFCLRKDFKMKIFDSAKFLSLPIGLLIFFATTILPAQTQAQIPAFPGCEGFGCETPGGRGGKVVFVTNLNDSGPGSLRDALMMTEPRIVVFKVSGTIYLNSPLALGAAQSYVTVAGQTAPGDGIAIAAAPGALADLRLSVNPDGTRSESPGVAHDAVFRHLRFRSGLGGGNATEYLYSAILFSGSHHVVFDHNSFTWANDQTINIWGSNIHDITWSWNIVGEGGGQNAGSIFSGGYPHERITLHHNYLAHQSFRNYMIDTGKYDFINNVNYNTINWNFHFRQGYKQGPDPNAPDVINHYFKEGPNTNRHVPFDLIGYAPGAPISLYLEGNKYVDNNENPVYDVNDQWSMVKARGINTPLPTYEKRFQPHSVQPQFPVTIQSTDEGKDLVLANAGARLPKLDAVDTRLLGDFFDGGAYNINNVGQFPTLQTYNVRQDSDNDGMPDDWERAHGLNPNDASDNTQDRDGDGYTNIEEWINSIGGGDLPPPPDDSTAPSPPQNVEIKLGEGE